MISCGCDIDDYDTVSVGEPRFVTCREARRCSDCGKPIEVGDHMYMQSFYDYSSNRAEKPLFNCERCGDLILSLAARGFCFEYGDVEGQWREYLEGMG